MSLTSVIKTKEIRAFFADEFEKPRGKIIGEMKAPPLTNRYSMVGIAFDYLLRFYLKHNYPDAIEKPWIAEVSTALLNDHGHPLFDRALDNLTYSKLMYKEYLETGEFTEEVIRASILLAQLDPYYRAMWIDDTLGSVDPKDVKDLHNLISLLNPEMFKVKDYCLLNPTFNDGSKLVGGADADIVFDNKIIDIKTTKKMDVNRDVFHQIIGYYILATVGGMGDEKIDASNISELSIYFSRYGIMHTFKLDEIVNQDTLPDFIDRFKARLDDMRNSH